MYLDALPMCKELVIYLLIELEAFRIKTVFQNAPNLT